MRRLWLLLAGAWAVGCGAPAPGGRLGFDLFAGRAVQDQVSALQVSVLPKTAIPDCVTAQHNCIAKQVDWTKLIPLADATGKEHPALLFPLEASDGGVQDLSVSGIPVGQNFVVVIEALTRDSPPNLYGSSCNYVSEITAGNNATLLAATIGAPPGADAGYVAACDPRFEK